ncbi:hypothetical protein J7E95_38175 [Streptomyces sp. ISL-14]|nr:hypothetical protein [Streptomyces sp. ISL-14]
MTAISLLPRGIDRPSRVVRRTDTSSIRVGTGPLTRAYSRVGIPLIDVTSSKKRQDTGYINSWKLTF